MIKAIDVANFFITEFSGSDDPMTKVRVQKFMYFAQAEALVRLGRALFREDFKAWHYGPVVPSVSNRIRNVGDGEPITRQIGEYDVQVFSMEELDVLIDVSMYCGRFSTSELSRRTHVKGGPWEAVHREDGEAATITKASIKEFYSKREPVPHSLHETISRIPTEGYVDADGRTIVPDDWEWES
ncbi:MAG: DUF4065 domain-containing protein [Lachnospiraceae bacterium]|nr:DUF4065 domain-containing protein [Lachnospiraceae bacterium]